MTDLRTGNVIVHNGEIYNFGHLRSELEQRGEQFKSGSDTEVLLASYRAWGAAMLPRIRGMYAFAIWDLQRQYLFLARDRVGVKPLYYAHRGGQLIFASELRGVLASGLVPNELSVQAADSYLALGAVHEPDTIVRDVHMFPPGHYGIWRDGSLETSEYWSVERCFQQSTPQVTWADSVSAVKAGLAEAVKLRLTSDAPIGVFLSGGVDSSAVTALAAQQSSQPVRTLSITFREAKFNEAPYVDLMVTRYRTRHTSILLTADDLLQLLPESLAAMDQPTFDGVNTYIVSRKARATGLTVALSGIGGDELFGGYPSFKRLHQIRLLRRLTPRFSRRAAATAFALATNDNDQARKLAQWLCAPSGHVGGDERLTRELFAPADRMSLLPRANATRNGNNGIAQAGVDEFNALSSYELRHYMRNVLLRDMDAMSMASSVELREPFVDHRLIELVAALPGKLKRSHGGSKSLLRAAMQKDLPPAILARPKKGFTLPFSEWMRGPLRSTVRATLLDRTYGGQVAQALDHNEVERVWTRFVTGQGSWVRSWSLFTLKTWGERWL